VENRVPASARSLALVVLSVAGGVAACGDDSETGSAESTGSPTEVLEAYRVAYNAADMDGVMALFTDESVLVDHPTALFGGVGDGGNTLTA
jgi:hypothetical protein